VFLLVTLPLLIAGEIPAALPDAGGPGELLAFLAVRGIGEAVAEAILGLILVEVAYRLMDLDRSRASGTAAGRPGSGQTRSRIA
jgi:hypothetical protein